jgi:hypothetical protein
VGSATVEDALILASLATVSGDPIVREGVICHELLIVGRREFVEFGHRYLTLFLVRGGDVLLLLRAIRLLLGE